MGGEWDRGVWLWIERMGKKGVGLESLCIGDGRDLRVVEYIVGGDGWCINS